MNTRKKHHQDSVHRSQCPVVVSCDMITPYGDGVDACWDGLLSRDSAIAEFDRFNTEAFQSRAAAVVSGLDYLGKDSLVIQMLKRLFRRPAVSIPDDSRLILATTKGEIDILEKSVLKGSGDAAGSSLNNLLGKVSRLTGVSDGGVVVSAACASSTAALARAAAMIRCGKGDSVLVAACDSVTEFVYAGFSSLMALDKEPSRPFDKNRKGLSLGEAAAYVLVMSESRAEREKRKIQGRIEGWGLSDDANHMTGPSRTGDGLVKAVSGAMEMAGIHQDEIGFISAHGTGTLYNDAMEMKAFNTVCNGRKRPVYSIKGGLGHTMGTAGLIEFIVALRALNEDTVPPTVNLKTADDDAEGWVSVRKQQAGRQKKALLTNAGFSGINGAVVLS